MAAGARPNVAIARDAGLEIGPRGGIVVDAQMRTSDAESWGGIGARLASMCQEPQFVDWK